MVHLRQPWLRVPVRVGASVLAAGILALAVLVPAREQQLLIGRPGDAAAVSGLSLPSSYAGKSGRWSRGDARLAFPDCPLPAIAVIDIATLPERLPDPIEIIVNDVHAQRVTLASVQQTIAVPVPPRRSAGSTTLRVRSTTTPRGTVPQGVFIERATLQTGSARASLGVRASTWAWLTIAFAALMLAMTHALRTSRGATGAATDAATGEASAASAAGTASLWLAGIGLAAAGCVIFRAELLAYAPAVSLAAVLLAIAVVVSDRPSLEVKGERWAWLAFAVGAIGAVVLLFPEAILHGRVLSQADMLYDALPWRAHLPDGYRPIERPPLGDVAMLVYPFLSFTAAHWWSRGHDLSALLPLWTASISSRQPFFATYQSALLAPFTWLGVMIPLPYATVWIAVARLLVGGTGMYVFLRRIGLSAWASAFGGLTYLLNPFSVVWLEHPLAGVPPWLPWIGVAAEAAISGRAIAIAGLAITTTLTLVGGHPHTGLFLAGFGGAYAIARAATVAPAPARWRALAAVGGALVLSGLLASIQILPFLEYLSLSRGATMRTGYALNPFIAPVSTLITALVPNFLGHPSWGNYAGPTNYLEQQIYPGIVTWLLAPIGVAAGIRRWRTWFFAIAATLAMLAMYGAPGIHQLVSVLPLLKAASMPRLAIIAISSLIVLAAFGVDAVLRFPRSVSSGLSGGFSGRVSAGDFGAASNSVAEGVFGDRAPAPLLRSLGIVLLSTLVLLLVAIAWSIAARRADLEAHALLDFTIHWAWLAAFLMIAVCLVIVARLAAIVRAAPAGLVLTAVAALDLLLFGRGFHPTLPPEQVFPPMPEVERIRQDHDTFRVLGLGGAMLPNAAMVYGLQDLRGYDGLAVARYADLLDVVLTYTPHLHAANSIAHAPLLDLLNVKYVFAPADTAPPDGWSILMRDAQSAVWRNDRVYPRAWLVDGYVLLEGNAARRALRDARVDGHRVAILEQDPAPADRPTAAASAADVGSATIVSYADERVEINTDAPERRLLVLTDVHYPGWQVQIDGQPFTTPYRANFAFRAVSVPAGRHTVVFAYHSTAFRRGLVLSGSASVALIALVVLERRRRPRPS